MWSRRYSFARIRGRSAASIVISGFLASAGCLWSGHDVVGGVTCDRIRSLKLGMTRVDIEHVLGQPFREDTEIPGRVVLHYSREVAYARSYPMLWIHLQNDRLVEVYAKRYFLWGLDDEAVYLLSDRGRWEISKCESMFPR